MSGTPVPSRLHEIASAGFSLACVLAALLACDPFTDPPCSSCPLSVDSDASEAGSKDSGRPIRQPDSSATCPADVSSWVPLEFHGPAPQQDACSDADIQAFYAACLQPNQPNECLAFVQEKPACASCLETDDRSKPTWGALVGAYGPWVTFNVAGCVELLGDTSCAHAVQEAELCESFGCQDCFDDVDACRSAAAAGGCKSYEDAALAACASDADSAYARCTSLRGPTFAIGFTGYAALFCQGGG